MKTLFDNLFKNTSSGFSATINIEIVDGFVVAKMSRHASYCYALLFHPKCPYDKFILEWDSDVPTTDDTLKGFRYLWWKDKWQTFSQSKQVLDHWGGQLTVHVLLNKMLYEV